MRISTLSFVAVLFLGVAQSVVAQSSTPPAKTADSESPSAAIERYILGPTPITLSADQQKKFDSLKTRYATEAPAIRNPDSGDNMMTRIQKIQSLQARYRKAIREMLTPAQQAVFDKNVAATNVKR